MKKILIIQTSFIGDVILATSLIESIIEKNKDFEIDFLVRKGNEGVLESHPHIHKLWVWDKTRSKYLNLFRLISEMRKIEFDYVINVQRHYASAWLTLSMKGKMKIGFSSTFLSIFYHKRVDYKIDPSIGTHEINRNFKLLKSIDENIYQEAKKPKLYPLKKHVEAVSGYQSYVIFAPASVWFTKQLPLEKWIQLANRIPEKFAIILIGSKDDFDLCQKIADESLVKNQIINLAGKLSLLESAALISSARMTFCNDSAPMHLASAMNAPSRVFYCSTLPEFGFGPLSDDSLVVETDKPLSCRPCGIHGKKSCPKGHFECGKTIEIEKVKI